MKKRRWKKVLALTMSLAMVLTLPLGVAAEGCTCQESCEPDTYSDVAGRYQCQVCKNGYTNCEGTSTDFTAPDYREHQPWYDGYYTTPAEADRGYLQDEITVGGIDATLKDGSIRFGRDGSEDLFAKLEKEPVTIDLDEHGAVSVTLRKPDGETSKKTKREIYIVGVGMRYEFSPIEFDSIFNSAPGQSVTLEVKQYSEKKAENLLDQNKATLTDSEIQELFEVKWKYASFPYGVILNLRNMSEDLTLADLKNILNYVSTKYNDSDTIRIIENMIVKREAAINAGDQISEDAEILGATELGATSAGKLIGLNGISLSFKPKSYLSREEIATMAHKALEEKKLVFSTTGGVGHKDAEGNFVKEAQLGIYRKNTDGSLTSIPPAVGLDLGKATISHQAEANKVYIYTLSPVNQNQLANAS